MSRYGHSAGFFRMFVLLVTASCCDYTEELKQDSMAVINRVRPETFEPTFQGMGLQPGIEGVGSEEAIPLVCQSLNGRGQFTERPVEMRCDRDAGDSTDPLTQASNSFNEWTDRVLPRRWASRPASTSSSTSWAVSGRLRRCAPIRPTSMAFQGIRMTSSLVVTDTVGRRVAMRVFSPQLVSRQPNQILIPYHGAQRPSSQGIPGTRD